MASAKSRRYGQGGSKHKHTPNLNRPNGKSYKQHPKGFTTVDRKLITVSQTNKGTTGSWL